MKFVRLIICFVLFLLLSACSDHGSSRVESKPNSLQVPASSADVELQKAATLSSASAELQEILTAEPRTFENTIIAYDRLFDRVYQTRQLFSILAVAAESIEVRESSAHAVQEIDSWLLQLENNSSLSDVVMQFSDKADQYNDENRALLTTVVGIFNSSQSIDSEELEEAQRLAVLRLQLTQSLDRCLAEGDPEYQSSALLAELVRTETAIANFLGWDSWAELKISGMMAKTPEAAENFLYNINELLAGDFQWLKAELTAVKRQKTENPGAELYREDILVYLNLWIEQNFGITYFTNKHDFIDLFKLEDVLTTLFSIATTVFGIDFVETAPPGVVWHDSVRYFQATDHNSGELLGQLYLDLYSREGKMDVPRVSKIRFNVKREDEAQNSSISVLFMNFPPPEDREADLISLKQTRLLFHEFGHFLANAASSSGYYYTKPSMSTDLLEIHSQLLERWVTDPTIMASLLGENPAFPVEVLAVLIEALRYYDLLIKGQGAIVYSMLNLRLYNGDDIDDPLVLGDAVNQEYYVPFHDVSANRIPLGLPQQYITKGGYYGYLWADVIARDIAKQFRESSEGVMNAELGRRLREQIYSLGYADDPAQNIREFLGRDWNEEAFYEDFSLAIE